MRKILISGGAGFAGHHLVEHLLENTDDEMVVLDSMSQVGRADRLTDIEGFDPDRVKVIWCDLRSPVPPMPELDGVTDILHLAAKSHVDRSIADPVPFVHNNVMATLNLLELARWMKPERFVQISTDEVYGPAPWGKAHKEWDPHVPSNPYAASKSAQGSIAISYWRTYGVPVVLTHTMNLYGERQHPEKFLPMTIKKVQAWLPVTLHGRKTENGWEPSSRHWLHARNHADALLWILNRPPTLYGGQVGRPDCWHIAGEERNVLQIAEAVQETLAAMGMNRGLSIRYDDYHSTRPGHDHRYALDSSKINDAGWKPPYSLEDALDRTIRWTVDHPQWLRD